MTTRILYTLSEAAEQVGLSVPTMRRAIKSTDPQAFPPPLRAKLAGGSYRIAHDELERWAKSLTDA